MKPTDAVTRLVSENQGLVVYLAKQHKAQFCPRVKLADLIAAGKIGLAEAAKRFNPSKGTKFSTYAGFWVRKHMFTALKGGRLRGLRLNRRVFDSVDVDTDAVFQDFITSDRRLLLGPGAAAAWKRDQEMREEAGEVTQWFKRVIIDAGLDDREKEIMLQRYGLDNGGQRTQKQIAKRLGLTRARISQLEKIASGKMAEYLNTLAA